MRTVDIARRAARSLRNAKTRTILTSLAIAVGAFTITVSLAAGEGARQYADKLINSNINPQALFIVQDKTLFEGGPQQQAPLREYDPDVGTTANGFTITQMTQEDIDALEARDDITDVVPAANPDVEYVIFGEGDAKFVSDVSTYNASILSEVAYGTAPEQGQQLQNDEVLVPEAFVEPLIDAGVIESGEDLVGMKLTLVAQQATVTPSTDEIAAAFASGGQQAVQALVQPREESFEVTIIGVSKQSSTAFTGVNSIQVSAEEARTLLEFTTKGTTQYQKYIGVTALVKEGYDPAEVKADLETDGYYAQTAEDLQGVIFTIVNTLQGIVLGFGIVALIASVFGIINTQYISVLERTREIGLMKALGMRGRSVSRLFQFEAAWIGFLGGIIGAVIAVGAGTALNPWISEALSLGEGNYILIFQTIPIILMVITLMVIAMLAGWFPARKAAKLDPIEALRTE